MNFKRLREPIKKARGMRFRYQFGFILVIGIFAFLIVSQLERDRELLAMTAHGTYYPGFDWIKPTDRNIVHYGKVFSTITIDYELRVYDKDGDLFSVRSWMTHKEGNVERLYMSQWWATPDIPNWQSSSASGEAEHIFAFTMNLQGIRTFEATLGTSEYWILHIEATDAEGNTIGTQTWIYLDWSGEAKAPGMEWEASLNPLGVIIGIIFLAVIYRKKTRTEK